MSRCHETDAVLDAIFAGVALSRSQAAHVGTCAECAHAVSSTRRFDAELHRVGGELAPEPMPVSLELADATHDSIPPGGRHMKLRRSLVGATAAAVLLVAVIFGGGPWLAARLAGSLEPGGIPAQDLNAWLDNALAEVIDETGRGAEPFAWEPVQVEECGTTAIAFYAERDPASNRAYRWAVGAPGRLPVVSAGGLAGSLMDADVATLRARLPICTVELDPVLGPEQARDALLRARDALDRQQMPERFMPIPQPEVLATAEVTGMWPIDRNRFSVAIEYVDHGARRVDRLDLELGEDGEVHLLGSGFDVGGAQPFVVYRDPSLANAIFFGFTGSGDAVAVEFIGPDLVVRYPVSGSGFVIDGDIAPEAVGDFRFLDARGNVVASGRIETWCQIRDPRFEGPPVRGC